MTLALSERCLAARASGCGAGAWWAWCVSLTLAEGSSGEPSKGRPAREQQPQLTAQQVSLSLPPTTFIPPGSSELHLPVKQDQHPPINKQKFWKERKACRNLHLNCCRLPLTRILSLPEVGLTHPEQLCSWQAPQRPHHCQGVSTWVSWIPERWGFHTPALSVCEQKTRGSWQGCQSHLSPPLLLWTFPKVSRVACVCCSLLVLSHCLLSVSGCQCLSPGWLGLCYFVLKLVCFFNGYK